MKLFPAALVFLVTFGVYLFTSVPAITGDDSGELAGVGATLGTAHSPGYPLYCMAAKALVTAVPLGNTAYRVNLASSLGIAATCAVLFLVCLEFTASFAAAFGAVLVFAFSFSVWAMANVTEVYGMAALIATLIAFTMLKAVHAACVPRVSGSRYFYAAMFIFGCGMAAHYTLGLILPGLLLWAVLNRKKLFSGYGGLSFLKGFLWSLAGFSSVLYLIIRANQSPVFGWEDPRTWENFWQVIARARYGAVSLARGGAPSFSAQMLVDKLVFYFTELKDNYTIAGALLAAAGAAGCLKDKKYGWALIAMVVASGPGFLFIANTGLDQSSKELLERFFFLSYIFTAVMIAGGIRILPKYVRGASLLIPMFLVWQNFPALNHRQEYLFNDYGRNIIRTLPAGSLLFSDRADEMEFALGYMHLAEGLRPDMKFVDCNAGVTRSVYGEGYYRVWGQPRLDRRLSVESGMIRDYPGPVYYATFFPEMINIPRAREGLLFRAKPLKAAKVVFPYEEIYVIRLPDISRMDRRQSGLAFSYYQLMGEYYLDAGDGAKAKRFFSAAPLFDATGSWGESFGFKFQQKGMTGEALEFYEKAARLGKATPTLLTNLGVIYEQLGRTRDAVKSYNSAVSVSTDGALQAHYNLAVLYWKRENWDEVIKEFGKVLEIAPANAQARRYLALASAKKDKRNR